MWQTTLWDESRSSQDKTEKVPKKKKKINKVGIAALTRRSPHSVFVWLVFLCAFCIYRAVSVKWDFTNLQCSLMFLPLCHLLCHDFLFFSMLLYYFFYTHILINMYICCFSNCLILLFPIVVFWDESRITFSRTEATLKQHCVTLYR